MHNILVLARKIEGHEFTIKDLPDYDGIEYRILEIVDNKSLPYVIETIQEEYFSGIVFEGFFDEVGIDLFSLFSNTFRMMQLGTNTPCDVPISLVTYEQIESVTDLPIASFCVTDYSTNIIEHLIALNILSEKTHRSGFLPYRTIGIQDRPKSIAMYVIEDGQDEPYIFWVSKELPNVLNFVGDILSDLALCIGRTLNEGIED